MDQKGRKQTLIQLEGESQRHNRSQIFMEAPYRNNQMLKTIIDSCQSETKLCIATDITLQSERIVCKKISEWKNEPLTDLHKRPTIFILYAK